jgi:glycosyltransferase involved in cell wall biosynthesis
MRALYLTHHCPWPVTSGGRVRDAALVPRLARLVDIEVWAVSRTVDEDRVALREETPPFPVRVFADEARPQAFPTRDSVAVRRRLQHKLRVGEEFDIVHVEGHYLFHLLPPEWGGRTVVVEHNVESHLLRQRAAHSLVPVVSPFDMQVVEAAEEHVWARAGLVLTLSGEDRQRILSRAPTTRVALCPNGADHVALRPPVVACDRSRVSLAPRIAFLANYAYLPNQDVVHWLLNDIFPQIRRSLPGAELLLAGSRLSEAVIVDDLPLGVIPMGWVDDLADLWAKTDVVICPLRIGGGMKVKLIEAVRAGLLIVATGVALEGMPQAVVDAVIRADDADSFAAGVVSACTDEGLRASLQPRLFQAQRALPRWSDVARTIAQHWSAVEATEW